MGASIEVVRLHPGEDLRRSIAKFAVERAVDAAFILSAVGSLDPAVLRYAGRADATTLRGDFEILTLSGTLGKGGVHLHMSISDSDGRVLGGHVAEGCIVRTTAEIVMGLAKDWTFDRVDDPATGYRELSPRRK